MSCMRVRLAGLAPVDPSEPNLCSALFLSVVAKAQFALTEVHSVVEHEYWSEVSSDMAKATEGKVGNLLRV